MISDKSFNINLNPSKLFVSDYPIKSKAFCRVFIDSIGEGTWSVIADTAYDVINDTVVFATIPTGKYLVIQVATTPAELTQAPTDSTAILTIKNEIKTAGSNASSIITVSDNIESIKSVKTSLADVTVVKNNIGNVNIVADNIDNVNTVALNTTNINLVKNNTTNINTVAGNNTNISVVSSNIDNVNTVAGNNTNINIVKDNVNNMTTVVNNITAIQNAQANSSVATTKAQEASDSATTASNSVTKAYQWAENPLNVEVEGGKYSAKHWANKAMEFSGFGDFMALFHTKIESDARFVHLEGSENINGIKNFTGKVQVVTPTDNIDAVNKGYVDTVNKKRKNYLINGNFQFWDYATSQTTTGYGSDNRWVNINSVSTKTHSRMISGDIERALFESPFYSRTVVSNVAGVNSEVRKIQHIEDVTKLAGKTVTLSFWAKADSAKNIAVEFYQSFGTGGTPSSLVFVIPTTISLTTVWKKYSVTLTVPSIIGKILGTDGVHTTFLGVSIWFNAGSNYASRTNNLGQQSGTFDIAEVKLEDGSTATDGWAPYDGEWGSEAIARMRYHQVITFNGYVVICPIHNHASGTSGGCSIGINTPMRLAPSLSASWLTLQVLAPNGGAYNVSSVGIYNSYVDDVNLSFVVVASQVPIGSMLIGGDLKLLISAEIY